MITVPPASGKYAKLSDRNVQESLFSSHHYGWRFLKTPKACYFHNSNLTNQISLSTQPHYDFLCLTHVVMLISLL